MKVLIIKNNQIINYDLPSKIFGNYWIKDTDLNGHERNLINVEEFNGKWKIKSNNDCKIVYNNTYQEAVYLALYSYCELEVKGEVEHFILYCCPVYEKSYNIYAIKGTRVLLVGNDSSNHIIYKSNDIARQQIKLTSNNVFWNIQNIQENRKVYVNNIAVSNKNLVYGDIIFLMGLKIIVLNNYILINNPNNLVEVNSSYLELVNLTEVQDNPEEDDDTLEVYSKNDYYYRSPRFKNNITKEELTIDPPPNAQNNNQLPFWLAMGSMMVMGMRSVMSLMTVIDSVATKQSTWKEAMPSLVTNGSMIVGSIMIPIVTRMYQKREAKRYERKRQKKYSAYLAMQRNVINNIIKKQRDILLSNYPEVEECYNIIVNRKRNLWESENIQASFTC